MAIIVLLLLTVLAGFTKRAPGVVTPTVIISFFMLVTFVVVVIYSTLREIPKSETGELLLGALISTFTTVIVYWFGKGSGPPDNKE